MVGVNSNAANSSHFELIETGFGTTMTLQRSNYQVAKVSKGLSLHLS